MIEKKPQEPRSDRVELARELETSRRRFRTAIELAGVKLYGQDRDLRYTWAINPLEHSSSPVSHESDWDILDPASAALVVPAKRAALETGELQRLEFSRIVFGEVRWYDLRIEPERDADGQITGLICAALDITDRKRWEEHQRVLLLELAHRSKNLLAVVQSLANQTGQGSTSVEEFKRRFFGRLHSLSRAHEILSDQNWRGAGMRELIRSQVLMYVGEAVDRIRYEGPPVYLRPNAAQHIGLALHELTTNALKYGALKGVHGLVEVSWSFEKQGDQEQLVLTWKETPSTGISPPAVRNFGRILLETVVPASVEGTASLEFSKTGVSYRLSIPSGELA